jgi:hypothetical protein
MWKLLGERAYSTDYKGRILIRILGRKPVLLHRFIMEQALGHKLVKDERVFCVGVKGDFRLKSLVLGNATTRPKIMPKLSNGRIVGPKGYVSVPAPIPSSGKRRLRYEHVVNKERQIGRPLQTYDRGFSPEEIESVHHLFGKGDNKPEHTLLMRNFQHGRLTALLEGPQNKQTRLEVHNILEQEKKREMQIIREAEHALAA